MIDFLISIKNFLSNLILTIETLIKVVLLSKFRTNINSIKPTNKKIILLANGPSIKAFKYDVNYPGFDFLTVNFSTSSELFLKIKPQYHIINAPELWKDNVSQKYIDSGLKLFNELKGKVNWPLTLFIPFPAKKYSFWRNIISENKLINVVFYNATPVEGFKTINHFLFRRNLGMPRPHNVVIPSLMLLIGIGYKSIYLLGVDHSWLKEIEVNKNNEALVCQKHFYDEDTAESKLMNKGGIGSRKLHEILHKFYLTFRAYFEIQAYAGSRKVKIYNATKDSFIDAFRRTEF